MAQGLDEDMADQVPFLDPKRPCNKSLRCNRVNGDDLLVFDLYCPDWIENFLLYRARFLL